MSRTLFVLIFVLVAFVASAFVFAGCNKQVEEDPPIVVDKHNLVMASFSKATYESNLYHPYELPILMPCFDSKWTLIKSYQSELEAPEAKTELWYQIYESDTKIIIAFRGTPEPFKEGTTWDHWKETVGLVLTGNHPQDELVREEVERGAISDCFTKGKQISLTGHSLGGHLAIIAFLHIQGCGYADLVEKVETYNAVGIKKSEADLK